MKQYFIPGNGFLFREGGLSLEELAARCHTAGFLSDDEFHEDGGIPALRRYVYGITCQHLHFGASHSQSDGRALLRERVMREANIYADEAGVNDPKYLSGEITLEDLERFGIPLTGRNVVDAELLATMLRVLPKANLSSSRAPPSTLTESIFKMVRWVREGRPNPQDPLSPTD